MSWFVVVWCIGGVNARGGRRVESIAIIKLLTI